MGFGLIGLGVSQARSDVSSNWLSVKGPVFDMSTCPSTGKVKVGFTLTVAANYPDPALINGRSVDAGLFVNATQVNPGASLSASVQLAPGSRTVSFVDAQTRDEQTYRPVVVNFVVPSCTVATSTSSSTSTFAGDFSITKVVLDPQCVQSANDTTVATATVVGEGDYKVVPEGEWWYDNNKPTYEPPGGGFGNLSEEFPSGQLSPGVHTFTYHDTGMHVQKSVYFTVKVCSPTSTSTSPTSTSSTTTTAPTSSSSSTEPSSTSSSSSSTSEPTSTSTSSTSEPTTPTTEPSTSTTSEPTSTSPTSTTEPTSTTSEPTTTAPSSTSSTSEPTSTSPTTSTSEPTSPTTEPSTSTTEEPLPVYKPIVVTSSGCGMVTFQNPNSYPVTVMYGDWRSESPDGAFVLKAGQSEKVQTDRSTLDYIVGTEDGVYLLSQAPEVVSVKQKCATGTSSATSSTSTATSSTTTASPTATRTTTQSTRPSGTASSSSTATSRPSWGATTAAPSSTGPKVVTDGGSSDGGGSAMVAAGVSLIALAALSGYSALGFGRREKGRHQR